MSELIFLNKKEKQTIFDILNDNYGFCNFKLFDNYEILSKDLGDSNYDIFLINRSINDISFDNLRLDSMGLYIGGVRKGNFLFSLDGSIMFGKYCSKDIFILERDKLEKYILGEDLDIDINLIDDFSEDNSEKAFLLKFGNDFFGSARIKKDILKNGITRFSMINNLPKERRVSSIVSKQSEEVDTLDYEENIIDL